MSKSNIPLTEIYIEIIDRDVDWSDIQWGNDSVKIREKNIISKL